jgi:hypothetical protein
MFQQFYGFSRNPFSKTIPTADLFPTAGQAELAGRLTYLLQESGFGLVTGEIGSGKSTATSSSTSPTPPAASPDSCATSCSVSAMRPHSADPAWSPGSDQPWRSCPPAATRPQW